MKKIFLPLLALCGMVAGITLTSCGGGGGGGNMSGTVITVQSGVTYDIIFQEKLMGSHTSYSANLCAKDGTDSSPITINFTQLPDEIKANDPGSLVGMKGTISSDTIQYDDAALFFHILSATADPENLEDIQTAALYAPASFEIKEGEGGAVLVWGVKAPKPADEPDVEEGENPVLDTYEFVTVTLPEQSVIAVYQG